MGTMDEAGPSRSPEIPGIKHKVIGLVSGGKDSTFNLLHCVANGHDVVALATLTPEPGIDELDSHLYQSVGTRLLPLIAESMNLPLFTRCIKGKAVSRGPEYGSRQTSGEGSEVVGDETEDLYALLKQIKEAHPDVTALASGAILSNYQRLRIEHVCGRLGLVSISYLWQAKQLPLLENMLECGMEVVLVKVAGVGLGVDLVGKNLREVMPLLRRLESRYGSHPAGEGGEYETLTLSTPLFSHSLKLENTEIIVTDPEPYPVAYLRVESGSLTPKDGWRRPSVAELRRMLRLDIEQDGLDEDSRELLADLHEGMKSIASMDREPISTAREPLLEVPNEQANFSQRGRWFAVSVSGCSRPNEDVGQELNRCFQSIQRELESRDLSLALHASHITLLLPSMSLFGPANATYSRYFGTSPPSRATVAVPLPTGSRVRLEVVGFDDRPNATSNAIGARQALHVQGLSYWAPANIGPYSQAVVVNSRVALAGQIPLIPASLTLPRPDYAPQAILALQHVGRIRDVLRSKSSTGGGWTGWVESCTAWWVDDGIHAADGEAIIRQAWKLWVEREGYSDAPVVFVQAAELPKGALVEFQVNLHTARRTVKVGSRDDEDEDDDDEDLEVVYSRGSENGVTWELSRADRADQGSRAYVFLENLNNNNVPLPDEVTRLLASSISVKAYYNVGISPETLNHLLTSIGMRPTLIPVNYISPRSGKPCAVALEIFG